MCFSCSVGIYHLESSKSLLGVLPAICLAKKPLPEIFNYSNLIGQVFDKNYTKQISANRKEFIRFSKFCVTIFTDFHLTFKCKIKVVPAPSGL